MSSLIVIPARGGSKGVPGKNIKPLGGKPLIQYTIEVARELITDDNICVSTDDEKIKKVAENIGLKVPFLRPAHLASDTAGSYDVLLHALNFYEEQGEKYETVILLQPTSPFRTAQHVKEALMLYSDEIDMVVSVKKSDANPYYNLFEETPDGFLKKSKKGSFSIRQSCPEIYQFNGAIYIINVGSLKKNSSLNHFKKIKKYVMDNLYSIDIDTKSDWDYVEYLLSKEQS